jgi:GR25 family glycosyltransferase involved in LPS biosynthesis
MNARVMNLEPTGERWDGFVSSAADAGLAFTRFPAFDTRAMTLDGPEAKQVAHGPGTLKAMVGCTLSHLALWQECVASGEPMLIFEDDARFVEGVWDLALIESLLGTEADVLMMHAIASETPPVSEPAVPIQPEFWLTTCGYAITAEAAAALLAYCRREWRPELEGVPTHEWEGRTCFYWGPHIVDRFIHRVAITGDLRVRLMVPNPIAHSGLESTIVGSDYLIPPKPLPEVRPMPFNVRKANTLRSLDRVAEHRLAQGVEVGGILLAAGEKDQVAFARLLTLLREAHDLQPDAASKSAFLATPQVITDLNGQPHTLPDVGSLRQLLVGYGAAVRDLWTAHATRRAGVAAAADETELEATLAD